MISMNHVDHNIRVYNQYTNEYMQKFMDLSLYKNTFEYLIQVVPPAGKILELGCGPGNVIKYLSAQRPDLHFTGIDLAPEMIKAAQEQNPGAAFKLLDIRHAGEINEQFHAAIAAFSIPYIAADDLQSFFATVAKLVAPGGLFYLSCMEGPPEKSGFEKTSFTGNSNMYITYYERSLLERLMTAHNFQVEQFYTIDYPETDGSITTDLVYIARKN